ncbi:MAG: peptidylprolyl isomerase [Candidatus Limnocylindrales bacterium]
MALGACTSVAGSPAPSATGSSASASSAPGLASSDPSGCPTSQPAPLPAGEHRTVTITTDLGGMTLDIAADLSPIAAGNFVALATCGYYDDVVFHRVVPGFVIQGGDPEGTGTGGPGYTIQDEPVTSVYQRGTVAMARTARPNSVGSQFFIVLDDEARTALADPSANNYQIIGSVTSGMETADAIAAAAAGQELPSRPVVMTDVSVNP